MQPQQPLSSANPPGSSRPRQMRPTLIVGLGGTGQEVLVRVKARFMETFGPDALRVIKIAALDTIGLNREVPLSNGQTVRLDRNTEFLDIGNVPTVQVLRNLDTSYPQVKAWLPSNLPGQAITQGAQMIRPLGRLAFFFHFRKILDYFDGQIRALSSIHTEYVAGKVSQDGEPGLNIVLVSSICGGTGSGIFLDTAYLLRDLCEQRLQQPRISLTGILALPQVFAMVSSDQIKANAFAALREIDQFTRGTLDQNYDVEYPGGYRVHSALRPFNICYLVDGVNEQGKVLSGMGEFAPLITESIFMQISSQIGKDATAVFDNLKTINSSVPALDDDGVPHMTAYSGMGMASLHFPSAAIIDACGRRFATRLISQGLLAEEPSKARVEGEIDKLLNLLQVRDDQILAAVTRDDQGRPLNLPFDKAGLVVAMLEVVGKPDLLNQIGTRANRLDEILNDSIRKQLDRNFKTLETSLGVQLDEAVARLLEDLTGGLLLIKPLLTDLRANLSTTMGVFDRRRKEQQDGLEKSEQPIIVARQRLQQALEALVDLGGRGRKEKTTALVGTHTRQFLLRFELMRLDCALRTLAALINAVDRHLRANDTILDRLINTAERFLRDDQEQTRQWDARQDALNQMITDANDLEVLYQEYVRDVSQQLRNLVEPEAAGPIASWNERYPTYEQVSTMVLNFAQRVFLPIATRKIENELMRKRELADPSVRLEKCITAATPFWSVQMARVPNGGSDVEGITIIGVEDQETSIYKDRLNVAGVVGTTTLDPHRITVLRTKHGVPVHALGHYDEYQRIYNRYIDSQRVPLHIMPMPDIKQARRIFGLALALDVIAEEGGVANYVVRAAKVGDPATPLAKGFPEAVQYLSGNAKLVLEVERQTEAVIMQVGKETAREQIDKHLSRPLSSDSSRQRLERLLNTLVAEYRQKYLA